MPGSYTKLFYEQQKSGSKKSAEKIAPILADLLQPRSVIDVGCGVGHWLATFRELGVPVVQGIDGPWVTDQLHVGTAEFISYDFSSATPPYEIELPQEKYDLAMSLEFLEHLSPSTAPYLVAFLCGLSDVVVAGAAVPGQGGTHHVNERWPQYWASLFLKLGYVPCDVIRGLVWDLPGVEPWYAQNMIAYFKEEVPVHVFERARQSAVEAISRPRAIVHPDMFIRKADPSNHSGGALLAGGYKKAVRKMKRYI